MAPSPNPPASPDDALPPVTASVTSGPVPQPSAHCVQSATSLGRRLATWLGWAGFLFCAAALFSQWSAERTISMSRMGFASDTIPEPKRRD